MSDLIKRSDAIKALCADSDGVTETEAKAVMVCLADVFEVLREVPSADRPQGEWICEMTKSQDQERDRWVIERVVLYCSECKGEAVKMTNYCPHCGARMKGADDE